MADKFTVHECLNLLKKLFEKPQITSLTITKPAYIKLMAFINLIGDYEISGFGRIQDGKVTDFAILEQEVRGAYVECSDDAVAAFMLRIPEDQVNEWTLDWHSHVMMSTSPSSTDWNNYEEMCSARGNAQFPFMIVNKKQEVTAMQYISENRHPAIEMSVEATDISAEEITEIYNQCKEEIEKYCTKYTYVIKDTKKKEETKSNSSITYSNKYGYSYQHYGNRNWWDAYDEDEIYPSSKSKKTSKYVDEYEEWDTVREKQKDMDEDLDKDEPIIECQYCGVELDETNPFEMYYQCCEDCFEDLVHSQGSV